LEGLRGPDTIRPVSLFRAGSIGRHTPPPTPTTQTLAMRQFLDMPEAFRKAMLQAGNRCELVAHEGGKHGYLMFDRTHYSDTLKRTERFLSSLDMLPKP
jgi:hypothetical protein